MPMANRSRNGGMKPNTESKGPSRINWLEWTDQAFERAKRENKVVLLDISAVWCHWCHRLDQDTYSVPDIADYVERNFIPIRVDTDKRPDINRRYNMGGWPTTAFLAPDGRVISGGTYLPPEQMQQVLRDVKSFWEKAQGKPVELEMPQPESIPIGHLSPSIVDEILGEIANNFDAIYGGFGSQPKFPNTEAHELAFSKYHYSGNREFLRFVAVTLQNVGRSGTYDKEMGGFFRYSTLRDWSVPHFEKMCEDNAKWLQLYLHAYQITGEQFYADIATGIIDYVNHWLSDQQNGCFYGSQDADEEYYKLGKEERAKAKPPYIDRNIYTNWNAMMINAYLEASFTLRIVSAREFGLKSLDRLLGLTYRPGQGMYHYYDGQPQLQNQLGDQVQTARTLCSAYECTADRKFLQIAEELMQTAAGRLYDSEHGGFFDTVVDPAAPGFLSKPAKPLEENGAAALVLTKLFHLTGKETYRTKAEATLKRFVEIFPQFGFMAAEYAIAVDTFLNEPTIMRILGSLRKPGTKGLLAEVHRVYEPRKIIQLLDPKEDAEAISALGFPNTEQPTAYVCVGTTCTAPITEPKQIGPEVSKMVAAQARR
jgi:uncharacterized protein YyaL (SSP411 family)